MDFLDLLEQDHGNDYISTLFAPYKDNRQVLFEPWYKETGGNGEIYPSQGLLVTPMDYLDFVGRTLMSEKDLWDVLKVRAYMLTLFNHPERLKNLKAVAESAFVPPPKISSKVMEFSDTSGLALSIRDLGAVVTGTNNSRVSRRLLLKSGPFVKLGKRARIPFSAGAMPDVFGAVPALATMAMCHGLACVPRNGLMATIERQVDLVKGVLAWMRNEVILTGRKDALSLLKLWRHNLVGVIEPELTVGMKRAVALYEVGVRAFRVYSPEPGVDALGMVKRLRKELGSRVEIFAGQVVSVEQAKKLEAVGADGLYLGIGGGGRCITAQRSGSVVDWPNLVWKLRGETKLPLIVEGGASDQIGETLLLGAVGIGVTRKAAGGTIESPGGLIYLVDRKGVWFKPYGGEASARTKYLDGKMLGFGVPAFVEGETTRAIKGYIPYVRPTIAELMYLLIEEVVLALVFRGVESIEALQALDPSPLRRVSDVGGRVRGTH